MSNGAAISVLASHPIEPAIGKAVPIVYGHITDSRILDGSDHGDGQGPLIYVGDRVLSGNRTYGEFLWAGHAGYGPSGRPFQQLYFFNESVDNLSTGTFYRDGILLPLSLGDLATEAGTGGRIAMPGYDNWDDLNFTTSYVDRNGRRYTVLFLRGIWRDWALGINRAPDNLGGPFAVNAYGCESIGNATGTLILQAFHQYRHVVKNWCPPTGPGYQAGSWLDSPTYPDGTAMIDEASFGVAQTQSLVYAGSNGFEGHFILGAHNTRIAARELLARLNVSCGCESGFNRKTQYFVALVNRTLATTTLQAGLGYERDIFTGSFEIDTLDRDLFTRIAYRHTADYLERIQDGWRSVLTGTTETTNATAETLYGLQTVYSQLLLHMLRGKNRDTDSDAYLQGNATIAAVLALKLARISMLQHLPKLWIGPAGFNYELGDVFPLTHYGGISASGWTDEPVRIERIEYDPTTFTCRLEGYQLEPWLLATSP